MFEYLKRSGHGCWMVCFQMSGSESLYSRIAQGIQESRVVVACVTSHYHLSEVCQRELKLAESLGRPVVPVLYKNRTWPIKGSLGKFLHDRMPVMIQDDSGLLDAGNLNDRVDSFLVYEGSATTTRSGDTKDTESCKKDPDSSEQVVPIAIPTKHFKSKSLADIEDRREAVVDLYRYKSEIEGMDLEHSDYSRTMRSKSCIIL